MRIKFKENLETRKSQNNNPKVKTCSDNKRISERKIRLKPDEKKVKKKKMADDVKLLI